MITVSNQNDFLIPTTEKISITSLLNEEHYISLTESSNFTINVSRGMILDLEDNGDCAIGLRDAGKNANQTPIQIHGENGCVSIARPSYWHEDMSPEYSPEEDIDPQDDIYCVFSEMRNMQNEITKLHNTIKEMKENLTCLK